MIHNSTYEHNNAKLKVNSRGSGRKALEVFAVKDATVRHNTFDVEFNI